MFMSWIRSMLGPFNAVLDYFIEYPERLTILLLIWAVVYYAGYLQLKRIESRTKALILRESSAHLKTQPGASAQELYKAVYPLWTAEFKTWKYLYIPHRWDLWPVRPTVKNVTAKLALTTEWLAALLENNEISLQPASNASPD
jgi:hypothetical protein